MKLDHRAAVVFGCVCCFAAVASAQSENLLRAPSEAPEYSLSRIRLEDDNFGRATLVFDYTRTREGEGRVVLAGRSPEGPLQISFTPNVNQASGEIRLSKFGFSRGGGYDYEFYLVVPAVWAEKNYGNLLVSNKIQIGSPGSGPSARSWNAEEQAAYEKNKLGKTPPAELPSGYEAIRSDTPVANGMRVMAGHYGDWIESELLNYSEAGEASVRFFDSDRIKTVQGEGWLAATPQVLSQAASDPGSFSPSLRVLPGGVTPLPTDASPLPPGTALPKGMPLLQAQGRDWKPAFVVEDLGGSVKVIDANKRDFFGLDSDGNLHFVKPEKRYLLAVRDETLRALDDPSIVAAWRNNLKPKKKGAFGDSGEGFADSDDDEDGFNADNPLGGYHVIDRSYPIESSIPRRAQKLPRDVVIEPGSPVAYNWGRDWEAATLLLDEGDTVVVKTDGRPSRFAYRLPRYQVIIQDKTLRRFQKDGADKAADLQKTLRTWTDSTGQHKVEARFVAIKDGKVTLKTDAGRDIVLPFDRLSSEDQELLESLGSLKSNPFE